MLQVVGEEVEVTDFRFYLKGGSTKDIGRTMHEHQIAVAVFAFAILDRSAGIARHLQVTDTGDMTGMMMDGIIFMLELAHDPRMNQVYLA